MLILHDTIYLDATGATTDALLVRDGRVVAVGESAREQHDDSERVVQPDGACLFPGLTDAHCHLWGLGRRAGSIELSGADSWAEAREMLQRLEVDELPAGWVLGRRWDEHGWEDVGAAEAQDWRADLDALFPETPVCLHRVDYHAVIANTEALRRGGYLESDSAAPRRPRTSATAGTPQHQEDDARPGRPRNTATAGTPQHQSNRTPQHQESGGRAVRDADGRLTGLLVDEAMDPVLDAIPPAGVDEDRQMYLEAAEQYLEYGITCAHIARAEIDRIEMVREMHADGDLPLRMYLLADGEDERLPALLEEGPIHDPAAELSVRGVKFFADGALGSGGALLLESYRDGSSGLEVTSAETLRERAPELMEAGWQVAVHAIGDRAARNVLDAYEAAPAEGREGVRPRLEHAQMMTDRDITRLSGLSTVASIQPIHMYSDAAWADDVLSDEQLGRLFPWRRQLAETTLAAGSDFPIEDPNPWHGIATAISRRTADGEPFHASEALTREEILAAYTTGAARAAHWEDRLGQLRPGYAADVIALDRDPFREEPESIWEMEVLETWVGVG